MPTRSKFTADRRHAILELLRAGASRRTAASVAGVDHSTLLRWIERGKSGAPGGRFREFFEAVEQAEADPRLRALETVYKELPDNPGLAWKFLERREPGYAPSMPQAPSPPVGPILIQLTLPESPPALLGGEADDEDPDG